MPFNNKRNSRDDKSGTPRRSAPHTSASRKSYRDDSNPRNDRRSAPDGKPSFPSKSDKPFRGSPKWREEGSGDNRFGDRDKNRSSDDRRQRDDRPQHRSDNREHSGNRRFGDDRPRFGSDNRDKPANRRFGDDRPKYSSDRPERTGDRRFGDDRPRFGPDNRDKPANRRFGDDRPKYSSDRPERSGDRRFGDDRPRFGSDNRDKPANRRFGDDRPKYSSDRPERTGDRRFGDDRPRYDADRRGKGTTMRKRQGNASTRAGGADDGLIRLNRYIANAGICSRRKADELIEAGVVSVNGTVVTELGTKVDPAKDDVRYNGERLRREKLVYVLLNKPKDYITTMDDPQERRTVMHLVAKASSERIYPVGRLDRNTLGLLLMTNDGDLAEKLAHPRNNISKIYHVELSKNLTQGDLNKIAFGVELEDGFVKPDDINFVQGGSKREIGIQIHSGKNRIVRRIFEHLGYEVIKLDRVVYAHLTKKDLPRGRWRYLTDKEIIQLKHFSK